MPTSGPVTLMDGQTTIEIRDGFAYVTLRSGDREIQSAVTIHRFERDHALAQRVLREWHSKQGKVVSPFCAGCGSRPGTG